MGCIGSKPIINSNTRGSRDIRECNPGESARNEALSGHITEKIISDDRNIRTARIIRNATVYERYDILFDKVLGTGISGEVMEAVSKTTNDHVAIKTLSTVNLTKKKSEMLYNEIEVYLKLDHPNICKLLEVYEDESAVHLVMELCSGGELYERLAQLRRYTERDAARVTSQMLSAINYCHSHSICHRDIKLENWVYANTSPDAPLKLIDWGMSRIFTGEPMTQIHGTVYYVSPQVLAGNYDNKCDVWSIGVIVYMILSGSPPFPGQNDQEIINRIKSTEVSFDGARWIGISKDAKDYILRLLTRDPTKRPSAADSMDDPWLRHMLCEDLAEIGGNEIELEVLKNIQQFSRQNAIRRAALGMIAMSLTQSDMANMEEEFTKLDRNRAGTIKLDELTKVLTSRLNMSKEEAMQIFNRVDQTGDEEIHYTEFLAAALQTKLVVNEKYIKAAFQKFDVDNTGLISEDDLRRVMGNMYKGEDVGQIFRQADYKNNGYIDYEEFLRAIMDSSCAEPVDIDQRSDKTTSTMRLFRNRLLQLSDDNVAILKEKYGPATFTWGSCRRDARFKMDMASLEKLHDLHIRDAISEHDVESERDIESLSHGEPAKS